MDYNKYYNLQARGNIPIYSGKAYMRGYGFGSVFKKFFRWVVPVLKEHALPIAKNIGKEALNTAANITAETLDGKNFKESAKSNLKKSIRKVATQYGGKIDKRKKLTKNAKKERANVLNSIRKKNSLSKSRRILDIFDR